MKQEDKVLKFILRLIKKTWANMLNIRSIVNTNEKYILMISIIIPVIAKFYYNLPKIFFIFIFQYFVWKALLQICKEDAISLKYKGLSKMFDNKVKVISVSKNKLNFTLYSFISKKAVEKKIDEVEHFLNREILCITRDEKKFKLMTVITKFPDDKSVKKIGKYKAKYALSEYIETAPIKKDWHIPILLGMDKHNNYIMHDYTSLNHIFISGETGAGKSTVLNAILQSMMYLRNNISYIFVDYKKVELGPYRNFNNCYCVKDNNDFIDKVVWLSKEMTKRYDIFLEAGVKDIFKYNKKTKKNMNFIVMVIDEVSMVRLSSKKNKNNNDDDLEDKLVELLNMGRASGILLIACTQNPHGLEIKANIRNKFTTNVSGRVMKVKDQEKTGVMDTQYLLKGEFKYNAPGIENGEFKSFFVEDSDDIIFKKLQKIYEGNENVDLLFK